MCGLCGFYCKAGHWGQHWDKDDHCSWLNADDNPPGIEHEKFQLQPGDAPLYPFPNWLSKLP